MRVGLVVIAGAILEQDMTFHAKACRRCAGLARVVRLRRALGDDRVRALFDRFGHQELELARLVAAGRQPGAVVALDPQVGAIEVFGQACQRFERGRQVREVQSGEAGKVHVYSPKLIMCMIAWIFMR